MSGFYQACLLIVAVMVILGLGRWAALIEMGTGAKEIQELPTVVVLERGSVRFFSDIQYNGNDILIRLEPLEQTVIPTLNVKSGKIEMVTYCETCRRVEEPPNKHEEGDDE